MPLTQFRDCAIDLNLVAAIIPAAGNIVLTNGAYVAVGKDTCAELMGFLKGPAPPYTAGAAAGSRLPQILVDEPTEAAPLSKRLRQLFDELTALERARGTPNSPKDPQGDSGHFEVRKWGPKPAS